MVHEEKSEEGGGGPFSIFFYFVFQFSWEVLDIVFERFRKIKYLANLEGVE
jgi:hypothetical protein